jgi:hypothetical protein
MTTIATPENLDDLVEFDVPFRIDEHHGLTTDPSVHGPDTVEIDATTDITVSDPSWEALSGFTGQYDYRGAVMHPSEYLGGGLARRILATPGLYVVTEVTDPLAPEALVGQAVLQKLES